MSIFLLLASALIVMLLRISSCLKTFPAFFAAELSHGTVHTFNMFLQVSIGSERHSALRTFVALVAAVYVVCKFVRLREGLPTLAALSTVDRLVLREIPLPLKSLPAVPASEGLLICVRDPYVKHHLFLGTDALASRKWTGLLSLFPTAAGGSPYSG